MTPTIGVNLSGEGIKTKHGLVIPLPERVIEGIRHECYNDSRVFVKACYAAIRAHAEARGMTIRKVVQLCRGGGMRITPNSFYPTCNHRGFALHHVVTFPLICRFSGLSFELVMIDAAAIYCVECEYLREVGEM